MCQEPVGEENGFVGEKVGPNGGERCYFFRYTLSPTFSWRFGTVTFPSVEAMMIVLPVEEGPNSFERSTLIVNTDPSMLISTFFTSTSFQEHECRLLSSSTRLSVTCARGRPMAPPSPSLGRSRFGGTCDGTSFSHDPGLASEGRADEFFGDTG